VAPPKKQVIYLLAFLFYTLYKFASKREALKLNIKNSYCSILYR